MGVPARKSPINSIIHETPSALHAPSHSHPDTHCHSEGCGISQGGASSLLTKPEGWKSKFEEGRLYITTDDDESVIIEVSALKTPKSKGAETLAEMKASVEETFKDVEYKPMQEGGSNNVGL